MQPIFSTSKVHPRDRLTYWRDEASKAYVAHEFSSEIGQAFNGTIRAGSLDLLTLSLFTSDACTVRRTQECLRQDGDDDLLVGVQVAGGMTICQDGRECDLAANDIVLIEPRRPFTLNIRDGNRCLVTKVPRRHLQARLADVSGLNARTLHSDEPAAGLAAGFLAMLPERLDALDGSMAGATIAHQALDLVALAFAGHASRASVTLSSRRAAALLALKAKISGMLCDPDLKPAGAAAAAGISVRYANSLLAEEGTSLEQFIISRRLDRCYAALIDPAQAQRTVSEIAFSYGFSDLSHFGRRFKSQFGQSPRERRRSSLASP